MLEMEDLESLVLSTRIDDMHIRTVLDTGFINRFQMSAETHAHAYFELLVAAETEFYVDLSDGNSLRMQPDAICLLPPGVYHRTRKAGEHSRMLALRFDFSREGKGCAYARCSRQLSFLKEASVIGGCSELCALVRRLAAELGSGRFAEEDYVQSLLVQIYIGLFRIFCEAPAEKSAAGKAEIDEQDVRRLRIEEYFIAHYSEPVVAEDLAREMNLSRRQLGRVLSQIWGRSFRKLLIEARLEHAAQLLTETDIPVEAVAAQVGYTSLSGFYSAFSSRFGISAARYRRLRADR